MSRNKKMSVSSEALSALWQILDDVEQYLAPTSEREREQVPLFSDAEALDADQGQAIGQMDLASLASQVVSCTSCVLSEKRAHPVFGSGEPGAKLMVVGEGPGEMEDRTGKPFVGKAGEYLDAWLSAISLSRIHDIYITNVVKCRPPHNRDPEIQEVAACLPYLIRQIELIRPQMILCLGRYASQTILENQKPLRDLRGTVHRYHDIPTVVTYHPAAVLRNTGLRKEVWEDLKLVASYLDLALKTR
ncbi:MAG: uracil-DNA glycosylase [Sphaerochaetaceae bacterium]|nr:uracil-DNA glycosylase [Sphaerochaetaceae bacterium]